MVRFVAMESTKNTIILGCFLLACTLIYVIANRNDYSTANDRFLRVNKLTGTVQAFSTIEKEWVTMNK